MATSVLQWPPRYCNGHHDGHDHSVGGGGDTPCTLVCTICTRRRALRVPPPHPRTCPKRAGPATPPRLTCTSTRADPAMAAEGRGLPGEGAGPGGGAFSGGAETSCQASAPPVGGPGRAGAEGNGRIGGFGFIVPSALLSLRLYCPLRVPPRPSGPLHGALDEGLQHKDGFIHLVLAGVDPAGGHRGDNAVPNARPCPRPRRSLVDVALEGLQLLALGGRDHLLDLLQLRGLGAGGLHGGQDGFHALGLLQQPPGDGDNDTVASARPHNPAPLVPPALTCSPWSRTGAAPSGWPRSGGREENGGDAPTQNSTPNRTTRGGGGGGGEP